MHVAYRPELGLAGRLQPERSVGMIGKVTLRQRIDLKLMQSRRTSEARNVDRKRPSVPARADGAAHERSGLAANAVSEPGMGSNVAAEIVAGSKVA